MADPLVVHVDADHRLLVTEAGRDGRNGLTASVVFGHGEQTLGMARIAFAVVESRTAASEAWAAMNGCPKAMLDQALLKTAVELEIRVREEEAASRKKTSSESNATGAALKLSDPEPWPDPVDGAEVLEEVRDLFARYLVLAAGAAEVMALWVAHTYTFDRFDHTGYLAIVSPQKRSGKTTTLTVLSKLVNRPLPAGNVSPAAVYRVIQDQKPTLLVDELDRVSRDSDLWSVLNAGHTRGTPVIRTSGDNLEPRSFATFGPKVLVYIRKSRTTIPDTVEDRSIRILLQRQAAGERRPKVRSRTLEEEAAPIRSRLVRWAGDLGADGLSVPEMPGALDDRAADSWEPLLAVAAAVGGEWPAKAADLAIRFSAGRVDDETEGDIGALLLADLAELIGSGRLDLSMGLSAEDAVLELRALRDRPWSAFGRSEKPISTHALARLLKVYGLESRQAGPKTARVKRYPAADVRDVILRYVVSASGGGEANRSSAHPPENAPVSDSKKGGERVSDLEALTGGDKGDIHPLTSDSGADPADCPSCGSDSCPGDCGKGPSR